MRESTRYAYLLDLVCTDMVGASATVLPSIADHAGVLVRLPIPEVKETRMERIVWDMSKANWKDLEEELGKIDWSVLQKGTADDALNKFMDVLWNLLIKYIPQKKILCKKSTHPWLNSKCQAAILKKNKAEGTDAFASESATCAGILQDERTKYVEQLKAKIAALPKRSKQWWRLNRELLHRKAAIKAIPPLREGKEWIVEAKAKADAFAKVFESKSQLPPEVIDTPFFSSPEVVREDFVPFRTRDTKKLFKKLDVAKATGPDRISAVILKRLGDLLAMPFTRVCRRLFYEGCWPEAWKLHLIVPIYKKGSAFQSGNYRGVHLTSILSKLAEKVIGARLTPFLRLNAFGKKSMGFYFWPGMQGPSRDAHVIVDPCCMLWQKDWSIS